MSRKAEEFHWLKVALDTGKCEEVMAIGRLNHGAEYLWLWMNLAFEYANYAGILCRRVGDEVIPISADELAREMKGGFTEAAIRDGIETLIKGKLIYINSNGFMAITGLVISGDPAEPTLHVHNSNREDFRPISIGTDTKEAAYKREYRKRLKEREQYPQLVAPAANMSYAEIAKKAECNKQTVINHLKKHGWEDRVTQVGQRKYVPSDIGQILIAEIKGKKPSDTNLDGCHLDGLDGGHLPSKPSKNRLTNRLTLSNEPSNISTGDIEKPHEINDLDGVPNGTPDVRLDGTPSLIESLDIRDIEEDYSKPSKTIKKKQALIELYHVAFDHDPNDSELSLFYTLEKQVDRNILLAALKATRAHDGESLAYTQACIQRNTITGITSASDLKKEQRVEPERSLSAVAQDVFTAFPNASVQSFENILEQIQHFATYYSDMEIRTCLRFMSVYQTTDKDDFEFFIRRSVEGYPVKRLESEWDQRKQVGNYRKQQEVRMNE